MWKEKGSNRPSIRRESADDAELKGCESKMPKIGSPIKRPTSNGGFCGDQEETPELVINRERLNKSGPLAASVPVGSYGSFDRACVAGRSAIRNIWKHSGFAVPRARLGLYTAKRTPQKPTLSNRPKTPRTTKFQLQHPVKVA